MLILEYHSVNDRSEDTLSVPAAAFRRQMEHLLACGYEIVPLQRIAERVAAGESVNTAREAAITFDDGYLDNYETAYPILSALHLPATIFLTLDYIGTGRPFPWSRRVDATEGRPLEWEMVETMASGGLVQFGSHTHSHRDLTRLSQEDAWEEIHGSRERLEDRLGLPVSSFCYPASRAEPWVRALVDRAGYTHACRTGAAGGDVFELPRIGIYRHTGWTEFRFKITRMGRELRERPLLRRLGDAGRAILGRTSQGGSP